MPKSRKPTSSGWKHCNHYRILGGKWVETFEPWGADPKFQVCRRCGMARRMPVDINGNVIIPMTQYQVVRFFHDGTLPVQPTTQTTDNQTNTQGDSTEMTNYRNAQQILGMADEQVAPTRSAAQGNAPWVNVNTILYEPITVVSAYIDSHYSETELDRKGQPKLIVKAIVTFHYSSDPSHALMRFSSGWSAIREQVKQFEEAREAGTSPYPIECGVVEMLDREPFIPDTGGAYFPLRFVTVDMLTHLQPGVSTSGDQEPVEAPAPVVSQAERQQSAAEAARARARSARGNENTSK